MFRKGRQQAAVLTISALLVVSAPAFAAGGHGGTRPAAVEKGYEGLFARAWQWMQALFADNGGCIDPDGKCTSTAVAPPVHTDAGPCIDPDGKCTSGAVALPVHTDNGACMDPNGKPCAASPHG